MNSSTQRRRWPRRQINAKIVYGNKDVWVPALMTDIAQGGIGFKGKRVFPPGSTIFVKVAGKANCISEVTVVWATRIPLSILRVYRSRMGVKFNSTTANFNNFLEALVAGG